MADIAREMFEKDGNLRREFQAKLNDEAFAKSPRARLNSYYRRSPYYDKRIDVYQVGRIISLAN